MKKTTLILIGLTLLGCKKQASEDVDFSKPEETEKSELLTKAGNFFKPISTAQYEAIPQSQDKIDLGKKLYFDKSLSKDQTLSCNSCHNLAAFGVDNKPTSPGVNRNTPSVIYSSLQTMQFWDGHVKKAEEQAGKPKPNSIEHGVSNKENLEKRLKGNSEYQALFKKAFPDDKDPVTFANTAKAIEAFESQLLPKSKFDNFLDGDESALNDQEKKGLNSFIDNGCISCHMGVALGGQLMQKFGVYGEYQKYTNSKSVDKGLYDLTKKEGDQFMFKVPGLRNVEKTAPYFHDGSVASLKEAVQIVGKLQLNKDITDSDADDIVVFLKTLTADIDAKYKQ